MSPTYRFKIPQPKSRQLQVFAFDPSLNLSIDTAMLNMVPLNVPWEELEPGPVGEYLEVVDVDPSSGHFYPPVDLNDPFLLVQDGLEPSEGTPQFHQQMVYAVASKTIQNFEQALGRRLLWSPRIVMNGTEFIPRLRLYPHAIREANAYYSPDKKAILFGYFPASPKAAGNNLPGGIVFTCLSYDIIAHETTHALLDGMHPYFTEPSNIDVIALHEAFADIVALFQHFSHPEVLHHQIARTRGDLSSENLLAELAKQFGQAIGNRGALRSAIQGKDDGNAQNEILLEKTTEQHARGAILLAAVFDAFLTVYKSRSEDLLRIATGGTGILAQGAIHPDLVGRLAVEAAQISSRILKMCIRALDYCPPVDITFGEYLRAIITADYELVPQDQDGYRIAMIEAFRRRGIYPPDVRSLSEESLLWRPPVYAEVLEKFFSVPARLAFMQGIRMNSNRKKIFDDGAKHNKIFKDWLTSQELRVEMTLAILDEELAAPPEIQNDPDRKNEFLRAVLQEIEKDPQKKAEYEKKAIQGIETALRMKLLIDPQQKLQSIRLGENQQPYFDVISVRPAYRVGPDGQTITDLVVEITQERKGYFDREMQVKVDGGKLSRIPSQDFTFRGGTTILIDVENGKVRYAIGKNVESNRRMETQRRFYEQRSSSLAYTYFGDPRVNYFKGDGSRREPFALLHRGDWLEEDF